MVKIDHLECLKLTMRLILKFSILDWHSVNGHSINGLVNITPATRNLQPKTYMSATLKTDIPKKSAADYTVEDLLRRPGEGEQCGVAVIKGRASALSEQFGIMEVLLPPKNMIPPHTHEHTAQAVFVIAGELEFEVGGEGGLRFTAPTGSYILKPTGVQHCFWNATNEMVQYIELSGGSDFEAFSEDASAAMTPIGIKKAENAHDVDFEVGRVPKLMLQHRLKGIHGLKA